jgi:hypothetical protein
MREFSDILAKVSTGIFKYFWQAPDLKFGPAAGFIFREIRINRTIGQVLIPTRTYDDGLSNVVQFDLGGAGGWRRALTPFEVASIHAAGAGHVRNLVEHDGRGRRQHRGKPGGAVLPLWESACGRTFGLQRILKATAGSGISSNDKSTDSESGARQVHDNVTSRAVAAGHNAGSF